MSPTPGAAPRAKTSLGRSSTPAATPSPVGRSRSIRPGVAMGSARRLPARSRRPRGRRATSGSRSTIPRPATTTARAPTSRITSRSRATRSTPRRTRSRYRSFAEGAGRGGDAERRPGRTMGARTGMRCGPGRGALQALKRVGIQSSRRAEDCPGTLPRVGPGSRPGSRRSSPAKLAGDEHQYDQADHRHVHHLEHDLWIGGEKAGGDGERGGQVSLARAEGEDLSRIRIRPPPAGTRWQPSRRRAGRPPGSRPIRGR